MRDLGTIGGAAVFNVSGLNRRGQIIGTQTLEGDATWHPFLWDGKKLVDLGTLGGDQDWGNWINDEGDVVGQGALPAPGVPRFPSGERQENRFGLLPGDFLRLPPCSIHTGRSWEYQGITRQQALLYGKKGASSI